MRPRRRRSTDSRGYGNEHQRLRRRWASQVAAGTVSCARCGHLIEAGEPWDLGHDDTNRRRYTGPEHRHCNRATHNRNGRDSRSWAVLEERVPSGRVRCGLCGYLIEKGDAWQTGRFEPEHVECLGTPKMPPPHSPRIWAENWWGERE